MPNIQEVTRPLSNSLGLEHFGYLRIYKDARYYYLSNDGNISKNYIERVRQSHIYCDRVLQKDPYSDLKLLSWPSQATEESMEIYINGGYWGGMSVLDHSNPEYIELWWVAPNIRGNTPHLDYTRFSNQIIGFAKYFNERIIKNIDFSPIILAHYSDGFEFNLGQINEFDSYSQRLSHLVKMMFPNGIEARGRFGIIRLSPRQTECLRLLARGKCIKEISRELNLSNRTVEKHIKVLQEKTGYSLKSDLVKVFNEQLSYYFV